MSLPVGPGPFTYNPYTFNPRLNQLPSQELWGKPQPAPRPTRWWERALMKMF